MYIYYVILCTDNIYYGDVSIKKQCFISGKLPDTDFKKVVSGDYVDHLVVIPPLIQLL